MTQNAATMNQGRFGASAGAQRYPYQNLPLLLIMSYLMTIFTLFLVWPINWQLFSGWAWAVLIAYVLLSFAIITLTYRTGAAPGVRSARTPFASAPVWPVIGIGAAASIILLFPQSYIYTGRWPWEVGAALENQGEAYRQLYDQLIETTGQRGPIALARAVMAPFTFAVIPLGILHWSRLNLLFRGLVIATVLSTILLSLLRGTDRELAEVFLISGSALMISLGRGGGARGLALVKKYWKPALLLAFFLWTAASLFTERKSARLGGNEARLAACANVSRICADIDAPVIAWMPFQQRFGVSMFVLSSASGFYGLALGMEKEFQPTWGVGHSPASLAAYELVTGDQTLRARTYTYRNGFDGWSDENYWSTLLLWLANDFGFAGAVVMVGVLGFLWGRAWRDATVRRSDPAAVIFCLTIIMLAYLPANNQVFTTYDGYTIFFGWMVVWIRQAIRGAPTAAPRL